MQAFLASSLFFLLTATTSRALAATRLPGIHHWPEAAEGGGFLAYGPRLTQVWRQRATVFRAGGLGVPLAVSRGLPFKRVN